jgi:outer membrane murein-binding lipoprotein Lpp
MPGLMENVSTVNSFLRTLLAMVVIGALGFGGWFGYTTFNAKEIEARTKAKELAEANDKLLRVQHDLDAAAADIAVKSARIEEQATEIKTLNEQVDKLETSLTLLKVDHRVAKLSVIDQTKDEATGKLTTLVEFVEVNSDGQPIDTPREFRIPGDTVFVDAWVVEFEDKYVEQADLERGTSLILFKRLFGNDQKPDDGYPLDEHGAAPKAYARGGKMSDFEKSIFDDFWSIANDKEKATEKGIKANYGNADYVKVQKGKTYKVELRASSGPKITVE